METSKALLNIFRTFCKNEVGEEQICTERAEVLAVEVQGALKLMMELYCAKAMTMDDITTAQDLAEQTIDKLTGGKNG